MDKDAINAAPDSPGRRWLKGSQLSALSLALCCLLSLASTLRALEPPAFRGYVNDYAQLLDPGTAQELEQTLRAFEETDSTQVAVLTIDSLEGDALEDFSIRTVERWKVGQRGKDNGVLLLIVKKDRKLRIEVGRGLEGVLTDLAAGRIIDRIIKPLFKANRFSEGIKSGVEAIIQTSRGEFASEPRTSRDRDPQGGVPPALTYLLFGLFVVSLLGRASRPLGMLAGAIFFPLAAFFSLPSIGLIFLLLLMPLGAVASLLLSFLAGSMLLGRGGLLSILLEGGGRSGGGFGGFGGGSFGGGGASGDW